MKEIKEVKRPVNATKQRPSQKGNEGKELSQSLFQDSNSEDQAFSFMDMVGSLAQILSDHNLTEVEYEEKGRRIYLAKQDRATGFFEEGIPFTKEEGVRHVEKKAFKETPFVNTGTSKIEPAEKKEGGKEEKSDYKNHPGTIKSPMVGVVYVAPEPGAEPFIHVGDLVHPGQTLLIVEAMKVLNPIKATKAGRVIDILIHDRKPVEYDEPLVVIEE